MADSRVPSPPRGDEARLFRDYNDQLMGAVSTAVHTPTPQTIEDACAFAWTKFMECQPDRDRNWQGWLFRTAQRKAWEIERQRTANFGSHRVERLGATELSAIDAIELRDQVEDAFDVLRELPPRLQGIALLRALGFKHREISEVTGDSRTRVHHLVKRSNDRLHDILEARLAEKAPASPRAERLRALEREQPEWLIERIGPLPQHRRSDGSESIRRRGWRRAALALDDLRAALGTDEFPELPSTPPADPLLRALFQRALSAVAELHGEHDAGRSLDR